MQLNACIDKKYNVKTLNLYRQINAILNDHVNQPTHEINKHQQLSIINYK